MPSNNNNVASTNKPNDYSDAEAREFIAMRHHDLLWPRCRYVGIQLFEISSQLLDQANARVLRFAPGDLFDGALGHPCALSHFSPSTLMLLKLVDDVLMHRFCHASDYKPCIGSTQPESGSAMQLPFSGMSTSRESKKNRPPTQIRKILADNVSVLRDRVYSHLPTVTSRNRQLGQDIHATLSQVQRICNGTVGTSVDTVEWLALALGVSAHELFIPYFAVTPPARDAPLSSAHKRGDDEALLQRRRG